MPSDRPSDDAPSTDSVPLTDLDVIQRYSLAVRSATAPRADVIAALQADLAWLQDNAPAPAVRAPRPARAAAKAPAATAKATSPRRRAARADG